MVKHDCYWYHCEHQMGASIDCCVLANGLGDCPCSDDCNNYITNGEVTGRLKPVIPHMVDWGIYECPKCKTRVDKTYNFCKRCGRPVKWDD